MSTLRISEINARRKRKFYPQEFTNIEVLTPERIASLEQEGFIISDHFMCNQPCWFIRKDPTRKINWTPQNVKFLSSIWSKDGHPISLGFKALCGTAEDKFWWMQAPPARTPKQTNQIGVFNNLFRGLPANQALTRTSDKVDVAKYLHIEHEKVDRTDIKFVPSFLRITSFSKGYLPYIVSINGDSSDIVIRPMNSVNLQSHGDLNPEMPAVFDVIRKKITDEFARMAENFQSLHFSFVVILRPRQMQDATRFGNGMARVMAYIDHHDYRTYHPTTIPGPKKNNGCQQWVSFEKMQHYGYGQLVRTQDVSDTLEITPHWSTDKQMTAQTYAFDPYQLTFYGGECFATKAAILNDPDYRKKILDKKQEKMEKTIRTWNAKYDRDKVITLITQHYVTRGLGPQAFAFLHDKPVTKRIKKKQLTLGHGFNDSTTQFR